MCAEYIAVAMRPNARSYLAAELYLEYMRRLLSQRPRLAVISQNAPGIIKLHRRPSHANTRKSRRWKSRDHPRRVWPRVGVAPLRNITSLVLSKRERRCARVWESRCTSPTRSRGALSLSLVYPLDPEDTRRPSSRSALRRTSRPGARD